MGFTYHRHLFKRSVAGAFAYTVDCHFSLAGAVHDSRHGVCRSHSEVVMTVGCYGHVMDSVHMLHQIFDLLAKFRGQAVAGRVRDIHHCGSRFYNRLDHSGKILVVGSSRILGIELDILDKALGIFDTCDRAFENLLARGVELIFYMIV